MFDAIIDRQGICRSWDWQRVGQHLSLVFLRWLGQKSTDGLTLAQGRFASIPDSQIMARSPRYTGSFTLARLFNYAALHPHTNHGGWLAFQSARLRRGSRRLSKLSLIIYQRQFQQSHGTAI